MTSLPRVRSGLLRHSLDQQVLVYDRRDDVVHLLDPSTGCVLQLLEEGSWTSEGITAEIASRLNVEADPGFLLLALAELRKANLLAEGNESVPDDGVNRRDVMRKLIAAGAAAVLVPTIATLTATKAYAQTSGVGIAAVCASDPHCISDICCNGICATSCPQPDGQRCSANNQCMSNNCDSGFCVTAACVTAGNTCPSGNTGGHRADAGCCSGLCRCDNGGNTCACT